MLSPPLLCLTILRYLWRTGFALSLRLSSYFSLGLTKEEFFSPRSELISVSKLSCLQLWKQTPPQQTGFPSLTFIQLGLFWNTGLVLGDTEMAALMLNTVVQGNCHGFISSEYLALVSVGAERGWALIWCKSLVSWVDWCPHGEGHLILDWVVQSLV